MYFYVVYRGADKSLAWPGRKKVIFPSEWREFPSGPCLAGEKKNLIKARDSILLKSRSSLTCFRACFLPGRAKDLSAPRYHSTALSGPRPLVCVWSKPLRHSTLNRTPLGKLLARCRDFYLAARNNQNRQTSFMAPGGIGTCYPSERVSVDPRLRPQGHWDLRYMYCAFRYAIGKCDQIAE